MPFMEDPIFERSLTYEPSFQLDGQACYMGRSPQAKHNRCGGRNGHQRHGMRLADGARLVDRYEGLCKKTVQEVNCRHIGRSRGEVVTTRPLLFSQKLH